MYKVTWTQQGYSFGFSWTFDTLAEATEAYAEQEAKGYIVKLEKVS